jgi:hypothetical protein
MHDAIRPISVIAAIVLTSAVAFGADPPDVRINNLSGLIETVDATWSGTNYNVRYTQVTSAGQQMTSTVLTVNSANDLDPRIAIAPNGDALVAWWRDMATDAVVYRKRAFATGAWTLEHAAGAANERNSRPRVVYAGDTPWVAYQIRNSMTRSVAAQIIDDDPEPFRSIVATTSYGGDLDIQLNAESTHLWVTWIDNGSNVGYSDYSDEQRLWSVPAHEPFASDSVSAARARIRARLLAP